MLICTYEDRAINLVGLKLLVLSLQEHCPGQPMYIKCPIATPALTQWIGQFAHITLDRENDLAVTGYNVKPTLLKRCLNLGYDRVTWMDADILVHADFKPLIDGLDDDTFVAAQESHWARHQGSAYRTQSWSLTHQRPLPGTINTCFMRVTEHHHSLLDHWHRLLTHEAYQEAQRKPAHLRPVHLMNDQDPLTALLGSQHFADLPVHLIQRGTQIIHHAAAAGYTVQERLHNALHGLPPLVHAMARKPWFPSTGYDRIHLQLSTYTHLAQRYREQLDEEAPWMDVTAPLARLADYMTRSHPSLRALPLAVGETLVRRMRRAWPGQRKAA